MPFTLAHTAAVLPLLRSRRLSATGLIAGTMVPDFEYFFLMDIHSVHGHKISGLFYFDVPVAIALSFIFHLVAKKNFIDSMPAFLQLRLQDLRQLDFTRAFREAPLAFFVSVLIGAASHIVWDGFTHYGGWFVQHLPGWYQGKYIPYGGVKYPLWYALQHISTAVGLLIGTLYVVKAMRPAAVPPRKANFLYWFLLAVCMVLAAYFRWLAGIDNQPKVTIVISLISGFCLGLILLGIVPFKKEIPPAPAN